MSRTVTFAGYALLALTAVGLQVASLRSARAASFGHALSYVLRNGAGRLVLLAGWLWLGWHVFVRVDW